MTGSVRFWHSTVRMAVNLLLESDEKSCFETTFLSPINVGGELLLGGAYSDSVFKANSDFSDLYTSIKRRL